MAITVPDNFSYGGKKPNFDRDQFETLEAMTSYPKDYLDEGHISYCIETKKVYIWNGLAWEVLTSTEIVPVTYSELKNLRDNSHLVAGTVYRLTDYEFTTVQENTKSAGHGFDIILQALSSSELSEQGFALPREGDSYFDGNSLSTWQIWYTLENDSSKYAWADEENGKGVIYRMIDEHQNDCPYDFKNVLVYTQYKWYYTFTYSNLDNDTLYDGTVIGKMFQKNRIGMCMHTWLESDREHGVIYHGYHILSMNVLNTYYNTPANRTTLIYSNILGIDCKNNYIVDSSDCVLERSCSNNRINESPNLVLGRNCGNNRIDHCPNLEIGEFCSDNRLFACENSKLYDRCKKNDLTSSDALILKAGCSGNKFMRNCSNNTFGKNCSNNTFGENCSNNTFGKNCSNNTFGENCSNNTLDSECVKNEFGKGCNNNKLGFQCVFNTFGWQCQDNVLGNYTNLVKLKDDTRNLRIEKDSMNISYNLEYHDDNSGKLVPVKHPNLSTQPSILPYKFAGEYVYEQIWYVRGKDIVGDTAEVVSNTISENVLLLESVVSEITTSGSKITNLCETYAEGSKIYTKGLLKDKHYWVRAVWTTNPIELKDKYDYGHEY